MLSLYIFHKLYKILQNAKYEITKVVEERAYTGKVNFNINFLPI